MEQNNQNSQQQQFRCTGDCISCRALTDRKTQWLYCASQHAYNTMRMMQKMQEALDAMSGTVDELKVKISEIQNSEAMVLDPHKETEAPPLPGSPIIPTAQ